MRWIDLLLFLMISTALLIFTLRRPYAHRYYRFIAFECTFALIFLQADAWFDDPFRTKQLLSWLLLGGSFALAFHAFQRLRTQGAPDQDLEDTTVLVTSGVYRYIRHPLYASLILFGIGAVLKRQSVLSLAVLLGLVLAVFATARVEERANVERFGEQYRAYRARTKMFIPFIF